jgi:hypothetical protein
MVGMSKYLSPGLTPFRLIEADASNAQRVRDELAKALDHLRFALVLTPPPLRGDLRKAERALDGLWLAACVSVRFSNSNDSTR